MTIFGYKWLTADMRSAHGDEQWIIGEWKKHNGPLVLCESGYHACRTALQSLNYKYCPRFFTIEASGQVLEDTDKFVCSEMRLVKELPTEQIIIDFMIAVLKNCLFRLERVYPDDLRPRSVLVALEAYKQDPCNYTRELILAAGDAAWYAVGDAVGDAVWYAVRAAAVAAARDAAWYAARAAVGDAAWAAAVAAARDAARDAEQRWQERKLDQIIQRWS